MRRGDDKRKRRWWRRGRIEGSRGGRGKRGKLGLTGWMRRGDAIWVGIKVCFISNVGHDK